MPAATSTRETSQTEQLHVAVNIAPIMPTADNQVLGVKTRALSAEGAAEIFKLKRDHVKRDTMSTKLAAKYGITPKAVRDIWTKRTWRAATLPHWSPEDHAKYLAKRLCKSCKLRGVASIQTACDACRVFKGRGRPPARPSHRPHVSRTNFADSLQQQSLLRASEGDKKQMMGAVSIQTAARAAFTAAGTIGGVVSSAHLFNQVSAFGLGATHRPVPLRLPDLSQPAPPALSARLLGQMPQGSSLDALASLAASSAEHPRAHVAGLLPLAIAQTPVRTPTLMDVPSVGPRLNMVDHAGFCISQDKMGFPEALDMSLQAAQVHQARALSAEIDRRAEVLVQSYLQRVALG